MKKNIVFSIILLVIHSLFFYNSCGIEDSILYFQEPRNIHYESDGIVYFYGNNQEKDGGEYMFVGYDVYYYFNSSKNAKKAMVRYPDVIDKTQPDHADLIDFSGDARLSSTGLSGSYLKDMYQYTSIPVTEDMIKDVLEKGNNDNVRFSFDKTSFITGSELNPKIINKYIILEELFPNYNEYKNYQGSWADPADFKGFLDKDYYDNIGISPSSEDASNYYYKIHFYVIAKGFNSITEMNQNYTESLKSPILTFDMKVPK